MDALTFLFGTAIGLLVAIFVLNHSSRRHPRRHVDPCPRPDLHDIPSLRRDEICRACGWTVEELLLLKPVDGGR